MTLKDTLTSYLHKGKEKETVEDPAPLLDTADPPVSSAPVGHVDGPPATAATPAYASGTHTPASVQAQDALHKLHMDDEKRVKEKSSRDSLVASATTGTPGSTSLSRNASTASGITKYREKLMSNLPLGQFDIENATAVPLNMSLNHVGPLYYDTVKPGDVFSRQTGKVWFTIEVRVHTGPASEYNKWSVAWPIILVAGPSAAAISLAAIPLAALVAGTTSISALVAVAVEGVSAAFTSAASALGIASRLPFAGKYKTKAISAAKSQALEAQKFAGTVMDNIKTKGGLSGVIEDLKKRGGEPKLVEWSETPSSVHDITDAGMAELFDTEGPGPKGWSKKRWLNLKKGLLECKLTDRGWYAGREPVLRVVGGPRIVHVDNPLPKHANEKRTILEIYPLRLEKVVVQEDGEAVAEELARGEGKEKGTTEVVTEAAEAMRE